MDLKLDQLSQKPNKTKLNKTDDMIKGKLNGIETKKKILQKSVF